MRSPGPCPAKPLSLAPSLRVYLDTSARSPTFLLLLVTNGGCWLVQERHGVRSPGKTLSHRLLPNSRALGSPCRRFCPHLGAPVRWQKLKDAEPIEDLVTVACPWWELWNAALSPSSLFQISGWGEGFALPHTHTHRYVLPYNKPKASGQLLKMAGLDTRNDPCLRSWLSRYLL